MTVRLFPALLCLLISGSLAAQPRILSVTPSADTLGRWEKLELDIALSSEFDNPFDPEQVDLAAEFTAPSGKVWLINGFFDPVKWDTFWRVRFCPDEAGRWRVRVSVTDRTGTATGGILEFHVIPSDSHGMIGIAPNRRYLCYSDSTPFYGVGLWYNDNDIWWGKEGELISESGLDRLRDNGANFIAMFHRPLESLAVGPGRYDPYLAARLDTIFAWCEDRDIKIAWNLWFHSFLSQTVWGGWDAIWSTHSYSRVTDAPAFYSDSTAWAYQEKLYRYMIARWGASTSLMSWFVIDEMDGTEGWAKGDTLAAQAWCLKVHDYFKANDPWNRPTTGTKCGHIGSWFPGGYEIFDMAAREIYEGQGWPKPSPEDVAAGRADPLRASYLNYAGEVRKLWEGYQKPALIGESGWDHTYYEPYTPGYLATYHNVLWSCLASGLAATPFWWEYFDFINEPVVSSRMKFFSRFVGEIDFAVGNWNPTAVSSERGADCWAMASEDQIFGWVVDPKRSVGGEIVSLRGLPDGDYELRLYHTWTGVFEQPIDLSCRGGKLSFDLPLTRAREGRKAATGHDMAFILRRR